MSPLVSEEHTDTALIWCDDPKSPGVGSGLLVAKDIVLTARHVVVDKDGWPLSGLKTRLLRDGAPALATSVTWASATEDLALVRLDGADANPNFSYKFADLQGSFPISSVMVTGFPMATRDKANHAYDYTVYGSLRREGANALGLSVAVSDTPGQQTDWAGISGGAVFRSLAGRIRQVLGVIQEARPSFKEGKLFIAPVTAGSLADRAGGKGFAETLSEGGVALDLAVIDSSQRQRSQDAYPFLAAMYDLATTSPSTQFAPLDFEVDAALSTDFEELKRIVRNPSRAAGRTAPRQLLPQAGTGYAPRRLYLQAPGGYGKSTFIRRLMAAAIDEGVVVFYLSAASGTPDGADWEDLAHLFESSARAGGNHDQFKKAALDPNTVVLVAIDGLNESVENWSSVKRLLGQLVNNYPRASLVVTDRMSSDRALPATFERATLLPIEVARIPDDELRAFVGKPSTSVLLSIPFFLDQFYRQKSSVEATSGFDGFGRADIIGRYIGSYVGDDANAASALRSLAVEAYRAGSPQFDATLLDSWLPGEPGKKLIGSGIIVEAGTALAFVHQLVHDYLGASWLAAEGAKAWTRENFDPVTLQAQSFDALELTAELFGAKASDFVVAVYNWNYRAALDCILNLDAGLSGKASSLPGPLKDAIFALRAEKRFDRFAHTRGSANQRATDFKSSFGIDYAGVGSLEDLVEQIEARYESSEVEPYTSWKSLFTSRGRIDPDRWSAIEDSPLVGWAAASVFRRPEALSPELVAYLCGLFGALGRAHLTSYYPIVAIRWRIVHVLGVSSDPRAAALLAAAIADPNEQSWVKYGAVRSIAERATRADSIEGARELLAPIIALLPTLTPIVLKEIRDVAILAGESPAWWPEAYQEVLAAGLAGSGDDAEKRLWQHVLDELTSDPERR